MTERKKGRSRDKREIGWIASTSALQKTLLERWFFLLQSYRFQSSIYLSKAM